MSANTLFRHPQQVPLEVAPLGIRGSGRPGAGPHEEAIAVLCFRSATGQRPGMLVRIRIPMDPAFETAARVSWCRARDNGFDIGVSLLNHEDAYRARMVEQLCHIEAYRDQIERREGRRLDHNQAAREWIDRYAGEFPPVADDA